MIEIGNVVLICNQNQFESGKIGIVTDKIEPGRGDDWMVALEGKEEDWLDPRSFQTSSLKFLAADWQVFVDSKLGEDYL